ALEIVAFVAPERAQEVPLLTDVVEPRNADVAVLLEEAREVAVAPHRHDGDTLGSEIPATATRERLDGEAIARAFDEHPGTQLHSSDGGFGRSDEAKLRHLVELAYVARQLEEGVEAGALARTEAVPELLEVTREEAGRVAVARGGLVGECLRLRAGGANGGD